jgi:hypothetical protein
LMELPHLGIEMWPGWIASLASNGPDANRFPSHFR